MGDSLAQKGRFAPSPTGRMHLGNLFGALLSWLSVKSAGGQWLLRIEDIDPQRSRQEYADQLMSDLEWLGLVWDGTPVYQSQRSEIYEHYFEQLQRRGLTYPCYCTRADLLATQAPHESDGRVVYPGTCRPKGVGQMGAMEPIGSMSPMSPIGSIGPKASQRLMVSDSEVSFTDGHYGPQGINLAQHVGDFIIRRKDGAWAYQLAVVVDDALMGITQVVRGRDLLLSSPQQIYLFQLLGFEPPRYYHFPLLCSNASETAGGNGIPQRLSKRDRSLDMSALRERYTPEELIGLLAHLAGLLPQPEPILPRNLLPLFEWQKVPMNDILMRDS